MTTTTTADGTYCEIHGGPDSHGRYRFTLYWPVDYIAGHPDGEHGPKMRGQCFFAALPKGVPVRRGA